MAAQPTAPPDAPESNDTAVLTALSFEIESASKTEVPGRRWSGPGRGHHLQGGDDMGERTCSINGCSRKHHGQGWCKAHYQRWKRHGDPQAGLPGPLVATIDRFMHYVEKGEPDECWLWTGRINNRGYAQFSNISTTAEGGRRKDVLAHRWSYEYHIGRIPEGYEVDHVHERGCRHRHCVNPAHLEAVTAAENMKRMWQSGGRE